MLIFQDVRLANLNIYVNVHSVYKCNNLQIKYGIKAKFFLDLLMSKCSAILIIEFGEILHCILRKLLSGMKRVVNPVLVGMQCQQQHLTFALRKFVKKSEIVQFSAQKEETLNGM